VRFDRLEDWLAWQETCHPQEIDLGLDRIRQVAERLRLTETDATVITVAGTNGKGSCVTTLEKLLLAQGESVGAYISPHLLRYNERIRISGEDASDADLCTAFAAIDEARGDISLSYFEFGTLAALWLFRHKGLDYWVLEVGLGGRLDATNIIDSDVAVVTSIALDHQQFLGNDRESIGREKAGIFRAGRPVVCADINVPRSVLDHADTLQCPVLLAGRDFDWGTSELPDQWRLSLKLTQRHESYVLSKPRLPLPSVAAAFQVAVLIDRLPPVQVLDELNANLCLQGRFQALTVDGTDVYVDVAHNPAAAEYLAERLETEQLGQVGVVVAMMADKDMQACLRPLLPHVSHWWVSGLPGMPRAAKPEALLRILLELGVAETQITVTEAVGEAVKQVLQGDLKRHACRDLLVTGSFYTVSAALNVFRENKP
jgi:dihydrofolate synthase/folylpolyglutamate synthase